MSRRKRLARELEGRGMRERILIVIRSTWSVKRGEARSLKRAWSSSCGVDRYSSGSCLVSI
jgi:hypothetical protein